MLSISRGAARLSRSESCRPLATCAHLAVCLAHLDHPSARRSINRASASPSFGSRLRPCLRSPEAVPPHLQASKGRRPPAVTQPRGKRTDLQDPGSCSRHSHWRSHLSAYGPTASGDSSPAPDVSGSPCRAPRDQSLHDLRRTRSPICAAVRATGSRHTLYTLPRLQPMCGLELRLVLYPRSPKSPQERPRRGNSSRSDSTAASPSSARPSPRLAPGTFRQIEKSFAESTIPAPRRRAWTGVVHAGTNRRI